LLPVIAIITVGVAGFILNNFNNDNIVTSENTKTKLQRETAQHEEVIANNVIEGNASDKDVASSNVNENAEKTTSTVANKNNNTINETSKSTNLTSALNLNDKRNSSNTYNNESGKLKNTSNIVNALMTSKNLKNKEPELSNADIDENTVLNNNKTANTSDLDKYAEVSSNNLGVSTNNDEQFAEASNLQNRALDFSKIELPLAYLSMKTLGELIYPSSNVSVAENLIPVPAVKTKNKLSLTVYGGAQLSMKNLFTSDGNTAEYIARRKQDEKNAIKPNVGIDIELKRGHWTLTSGINFHQQGEKRNYSDQFKRTVPYDSLVVNINNNSAWLVDSTEFFSLQYHSFTTSHDTIITYYDEASGSFLTASLPMTVIQSTLVDTNYYYLVDSTYIQSIDTQKTNYALKKQLVVKDPNQANLKGRNSFTYVEMPVLIGYEWGIKRWRLSLKGGLGVGILTRQQSFYLNTDEAEIAPVSTDVYTKIMYNGIVRAGVHYNFTPQFGVDIVPFSRMNFNNMTNKNAPFKQRYNNVGLQIGLSYKL
jgi:hypothetical protein